MDESFIFSAVIVVVAGFVHSVLGFGFPLLATPLFSLFMSVKQAVLLTLLPNIAINLNIVKRSSSLNTLWKEFSFLIVPVVLGSFIGANLLIVFYSEYYKIILALMTLLYLNRQYIHFSLTKTIAENPKTAMIAFGIVSGIIGGMVNIMLPILIIYSLESHMPKEKTFALMNFCFFGSKMTQLFVFGLHGSLSLEFSYVGIPILALSLIGFYFGSKARHRIDEHLYKNILIITLWILSFYLLVSPFLQG